MKYFIILALLSVNFSGWGTPPPPKDLTDFAQAALKAEPPVAAEFIPYYGHDFGQDIQRSGYYYQDRRNYLLISRNSWEATSRHYYQAQYFDCDRGQYYNLGSAPSLSALPRALQAINVQAAKKTSAEIASVFGQQFNFLCRQSEINRKLTIAPELSWGLLKTSLPARYQKDIACEGYHLGGGISHEYCNLPLTPAIYPGQAPAPELNYADLHLYFNKNCGLYSAAFVEFHENAAAVRQRYIDLKKHFSTQYKDSVVHFTEQHNTAGTQNNFAIGRALVLSKFVDLAGLTVNFYSACGRAYDAHKKLIERGGGGSSNILAAFRGQVIRLNRFYQGPEDYRQLPGN